VRCGRFFGAEPCHRIDRLPGSIDAATGDVPAAGPRPARRGAWRGCDGPGGAGGADGGLRRWLARRGRRRRREHRGAGCAESAAAPVRSSDAGGRVRRPARCVLATETIGARKDRRELGSGSSGRALLAGGVSRRSYPPSHGAGFVHFAGVPSRNERIKHRLEPRLRREHRGRRNQRRGECSMSPSSGIPVFRWKQSTEIVRSPHDRRDTPVDNGAAYDSTQP